MGTGLAMVGLPAVQVEVAGSKGTDVGIDPKGAKPRRPSSETRRIGVGEASCSAWRNDVTNILGISAYYHDSAACLIRDGEIIAAAQEERFTRKKHDAGFPREAVRYCSRKAASGSRTSGTSRSTTSRC